MSRAAACDFNPRSPHGERPRCRLFRCTPTTNFNPRSPHGERRVAAAAVLLARTYFNPRSPHGERLYFSLVFVALCDFNPRSPHGERQNRFDFALVGLRISIHAPRTGSDPRTNGAAVKRNDFNPRSPHGERRSIQRASFSALLFQSTLPARGATGLTRTSFSTAQFQSTLPARGATPAAVFWTNLKSNFNPRSPHGERQICGECEHHSDKNFNPRSPHGERR